ncbi:MAG TPA: NUDIX domain-containing protein [Rhodopila sp.]|nr:NUDIX domain-containing protein [Rhodopila sp.]
MSHRPTAPIPSHPDVEILSERRVWSGRFPLDQVEFRHRRFDGRMSEMRRWELWRRGPAAAMLPYDPVTDQVVLIEQFRLPALAAGTDPMLVELPAGLCEHDEDPADTIRREMQEEMALSADRMEKIGDFLLTPGGADEFCHLYVGRVSAPPADADGIAGHAGEAAESEDIRTRVWAADAAIATAFAGRFTNSVTAIALFWLASKRDWLRQTWRSV